MGKQSLKSFLKAIAPPILVDLYKRPKQDYGFFGDYTSWEEALANSTGYDSDVILNKVKNALLQVRDGKAAYERDSVLFDRIEYSFPVLAALLKVALENNGKLRILDFGGSLGSSYYQYKGFLSCVHTLEWSVVEQPKFVECGREFFQNQQLKFYLTIEECIKERNVDIVLLFSVIQYLDDPFLFLERLCLQKIPYLLFDRTAITTLNKDILTIQRIDEPIYSASYPAWFLSQAKFLSAIKSKKCDIIFDFSNEDRTNLESSFFKGYFMRLSHEK